MDKKELSFEEIKKIAFRRSDRYNCYQEYEDAYYFFVNDGNHYVGGEETGALFAKQDGHIIMPYEYFLSDKYECKEIGDPIFIYREAEHFPGKELDNMEWRKLEADYHMACQYLWNIEKQNPWAINEQEGCCILWSVYYRVLKLDNFDGHHLLVARIYHSMFRQYYTNDYQRDYDLFHNYLEPAYNHYQLARKEHPKPSAKELDFIEFHYEQYQKMHKILHCTGKDYEAQLRLMENYELLKDFSFHDSKVIEFWHDLKIAYMKLYYYGKVVTLKFEGLEYIDVNYSPIDNWLDDCVIYKTSDDPNSFIKFQTDYYDICCNKIIVKEIEEKTIDVYS